MKNNKLYIKSKKKIAFFEVEPWEQEYLKKRLKGFELNFFPDILSKKDLAQIKETEILSPFIYSKINKEVLKSLPNLKLVVTRSTGYDHVDVKAASVAGVQVANVPTYGENTVAEHTFGLILSLSRKIHTAHERTVRGDFTLDGLRGFDIAGKTIGVIGSGHIGQHVIRMAHGFEMKVLVFDPKRDKALARKFNFQYVTLDYLLRHSDIVTLHAPYNKKTHHLINKKNIKLFKDNSIIINTARGGLIDTSALIDGLRLGKLSGIGLDVLEEEKYILKEERELLSPHFSGVGQMAKEFLTTIVESHILLTSDKVIVTPHNAFNSQEALERILDTSIENILNYINNKSINNLVK
jgi:D-lactate dehydrogenase